MESARSMAGLTTATQEDRVERVMRGDDPVERLPGVGEKTASLLKESGYASVRDLFQADAGALAQLPGISRTKADNLIQAAKEYIDTGE